MTYQLKAIGKVKNDENGTLDVYKRQGYCST